MAPPSNEEQLSQLRQLCSTSYTPKEADFDEHAAPWSIWADRHPKLVVVPKSLKEIQNVIKHLYTSSLDFSVRNTGTGGSSATDVVVSMQQFKSFDFDHQTEEYIVGGGLSWGEVDQLMEKSAPGYGAVGARCTWVGVSGGTIVGGLSWLSHEYGCFSDPQNFLDAQVVLKDGRVVWAASEEPDLMWALRGGGGNFGVITALKFRARAVPGKIFGGVILVPYSSLAEAAKEVAGMHRRPTDPKVAMHVMNQGPGAGMEDQGAKPGIIIMPIDFRGEAHARSEEGFAWAWRITGAQEAVAFEKSLREVNALNDTFKNYQGRNKFFLCAPMISGIDDQTLVRAWKWYEDSYNIHNGFGAGSTVLLEFMQEGAFNSTKSSKDTAWPHKLGRRHVMQTLLGCPPDTAPDNIREIAMKQMMKIDKDVGGKYATGEYHAGFLHEWNDLRKVYGENFERLKRLKKRYDPDNRFNKGVDLANEKITEGMSV